MIETIIPENEQYPGIVRTSHGNTFFPHRITQVYVYYIQCRLEDIFMPGFKFILERIEGCMAQNKRSLQTGYDHTRIAHVAQIIVEGTEPGSYFDYRDLEMTSTWNRFKVSGNYDVLSVAYSNMMLLNKTYIVSCSNNDKIVDGLENRYKHTSFHWISCT